LKKVAVSDEIINDVHIAYIGGGSMFWARELMGDLALEPQLSGIVRLYDIDYDAAKANETIGNSLSDDPLACGKWVYEVKPTLEETLTGADFVVISILPGTFKEMSSDVHAPEKYGIYQSVGDTVGPGGIVRAMRTVPMYIEIAEAIQAFSPRAWVINYTNPMSVCMGALYSVFPEIKAFGCCHEVFHIQSLMAKMLEPECGVVNAGKGDICFNVLGVNHFTWVDKASYLTNDLMPVFDSFAAKHMESGYALSDMDNDPEYPFRNNNKVCFDVYRRFGLIPAAGDRHISEFLPPKYLESPETVERYGFTLTKVSYREQMRRSKLEETKAFLSGREKFKLRPSGEEGTEQIKALLGLSELITNVNLPNCGQVAGLPLDATVETNSMFSKDAVRPVFAGKFPPVVGAMVSRHAENQKRIVDAGIRKDIGLAFEVFLSDNLMTIKAADAEELFAQMLQNTKTYLSGWHI